MDEHKEFVKSAAENIDLMSTILSRFDLIFIVRDIRDMERDRSIAKHVMGIHINTGAAQAAIDDIQQKASTLKDKSVEACAGRCALAYSWHRVSSHRPAKRCA